LLVLPFKDVDEIRTRMSVLLLLQENGLDNLPTKCSPIEYCEIACKNKLPTEVIKRIGSLLNINQIEAMCVMANNSFADDAIILCERLVGEFGGEHDGLIGKTLLEVASKFPYHSNLTHLFLLASPKIPSSLLPDLLRAWRASSPQLHTRSSGPLTPSRYSGGSEKHFNFCTSGSKDLGVEDVQKWLELDEDVMHREIEKEIKEPYALTSILSHLCKLPYFECNTSSSEMWLYVQLKRLNQKAIKSHYQLGNANDMQAIHILTGQLAFEANISSCEELLKLSRTGLMDPELKDAVRKLQGQKNQSILNQLVVYGVDPKRFTDDEQYREHALVKLMDQNEDILIEVASQISIPLHKLLVLWFKENLSSTASANINKPKWFNPALASLKSDEKYSEEVLHCLTVIHQKVCLTFKRQVQTFVFTSPPKSLFSHENVCIDCTEKCSLARSPYFVRSCWCYVP
jgi:hypothetical protein